MHFAPFEASPRLFQIGRTNVEAPGKSQLVGPEVSATLADPGEKPLTGQGCHFCPFARGQIWLARRKVFAVERSNQQCFGWVQGHLQAHCTCKVLAHGFLRTAATVNMGSRRERLCDGLEHRAAGYMGRLLDMHGSKLNQGPAYQGTLDAVEALLVVSYRG